MARLKSLTQFPPHEFQYINAHFGMAKPDKGSFAVICQKELSRRKANKYLSEKHGLGMDMQSVEYDVEQQNVARCQAHGWHDFIASDAVMAPTSHYEDSKKNTLFGSVVGKSKRVAAGVGLLIEWLGSGGKPVAKELADKRAEVCVTCPKNQPADIMGYFTGKIAAKIATQIQMKHDLLLQTSYDSKLGVCTACDCPLVLKAHTPLKHILDHTDNEVKGRLDPRCWILHENP
jgi:hypothetical protein